jgi:hypothetical protein
MTREMTRAEKCESLLDGIARQRAELTGESFEKAYAAELDTPLGRAAYAEMYDASAKGERGAAPRADRDPEGDGTSAGELAKAAELEGRIERMAADRAARTGEPLAKAYGGALQSPEGRRLYAEASGARDRADELRRGGR